MYTKNPLILKSKYLSPDEFLAPFDAMVNDFLNHSGFKDISKEMVAKGSYPKVNIVDSPTAVIIQAAVPGLTKDDITISVDEDILSICNNQDSKKSFVVGEFLTREIKTSSWKRSFFLNESLEKTKIKANVENGLLNIEIPKVKPIQKKPQSWKIDIE